MFLALQIGVPFALGWFVALATEDPRWGRAVALGALGVIVWGTGGLQLGGVKFAGREARLLAAALVIVGLLQIVLDDAISVERSDEEPVAE